MSPVDVQRARRKPLPSEAAAELAALEMLRPLVRLLAPLLRDELRLPGPTTQAEEWLDQNRSPLGRRPHCKACRAGLIKGARRVGRHWYATRAAIDAYIRQGQGAEIPLVSDPPAGLAAEGRPANDAPALAPSAADVEAELRSIGHTRAPRRAGGGA